MNDVKRGSGGKMLLILGLAIGLFVGPLISGMMGWQVSNATLLKAVHLAVVQQQVAFCEARARAAVKHVGKLDAAERYEVAQAWAKLPQDWLVDPDVVNACANGLAG